MTTEIKSLISELKEKLGRLDKQRYHIWKLEFRDFEDLRFAINMYDDNVNETDSLFCDVHNKLRKDYMVRIRLGEIKIEGDINDRLNLEGSADELTDDVLQGERERIHYHLNELDYFKCRKIS